MVAPVVVVSGSRYYNIIEKLRAAMVRIPRFVVIVQLQRYCASPHE